MKAKSWLPVFPGFYGTQFEYDSDLENELYSLHQEGKLPYDYAENKNLDLKRFDERVVNDIVWDCFDWHEYAEHVAKECCGVIEQNCPFIKKVTYEKVQSPKEYNFVNDSINCTIEVDKRAFRKWIYGHEKEVDQYLHDHLTSCDGFISFHPNNFKEWEEMTDKFRVFEKPYYVGALLESYFEAEGFDSWALREGCEIFAGSHIDYNKVAEKLLEIAARWEENGEEEIIVYNDPNQLKLFEVQNA